MELLADIEHLNKKEILSNDLYLELLSIDDEITRTRSISELRDRAKYIGCYEDFDNILNAYISEKEKFENKNMKKEKPSTDKEVKPPVIFNAEWLGKQELKPIDFIVEGLLPVGLNILASPPKHGKSFMALDLCLSVASGREFLGMKTQQCKVFYMALEDSQRRLQNRMSQILGGMNFPSNLNITLQMNDLSSGFIGQLEGVLKDNPETKLFVVDTLQFIRGKFNRNEGAYSNDYKEMAQLKAFADKYEVCILVIHHSRKETNPNDAFSNISGTNGITGAMDTMLVLSKEERMAKETKLSVCGRDVEQEEYILTMDNGKWHIIATEEEERERMKRSEYDRNPIIITIKGLLSKSDYSMGWTGTMQELLYLGEDIAGTYISNNESSLAKDISKLDSKMFEYDKICHRSKRSNGKRVHSLFYYKDKCHYNNS